MSWTHNVIVLMSEQNRMAHWVSPLMTGLDHGQQDDTFLLAVTANGWPSELSPTARPQSTDFDTSLKPQALSMPLWLVSTQQVLNLPNQAPADWQPSGQQSSISSSCSSIGSSVPSRAVLCVKLRCNDLPQVHRITKCIKQFTRSVLSFPVLLWLCTCP